VYLIYDKILSFNDDSCVHLSFAYDKFLCINMHSLHKHTCYLQKFNVTLNDRDNVLTINILSLKH
jgi:hypothetical protein